MQMLGAVRSGAGAVAVRITYAGYGRRHWDVDMRRGGRGSCRDLGRLVGCMPGRDLGDVRGQQGAQGGTVQRSVKQKYFFAFFFSIWALTCVAVYDSYLARNTGTLSQHIKKLMNGIIQGPSTNTSNAASPLLY
jgi:hypothetical protein